MALIRKSKKGINRKRTLKVGGGGLWEKLKSKVPDFHFGKSTKKAKKAKEPTVQLTPNPKVPLTPNPLYGVSTQNVKLITNPLYNGQQEPHYGVRVFNHSKRSLPPTPQEEFLKSVAKQSIMNIQSMQSAKKQERPSPFSRKQFGQQGLGPIRRQSKSGYNPKNNINFILKSNNSTNQQSLLNARARILQHTPSATISSINDAQKVLEFLKFKSQHMGTRLNGTLYDSDKQLASNARAYIIRHNAQLAKKFNGESSPPPQKSNLRQPKPMSREAYEADAAQSFSQHGYALPYEEYLKNFVQL